MTKRKEKVLRDNTMEETQKGVFDCFGVPIEVGDMVYHRIDHGHPVKLDTRVVVSRIDGYGVWTHFECGGGVAWNPRDLVVADQRSRWYEPTRENRPLGPPCPACGRP